MDGELGQAARTFTSETQSLYFLCIWDSEIRDHLQNQSIVLFSGLRFISIMTPPLGRDERTLSLTSLPKILARILVANESEQKVSVFIRI